MSEAIIAAGSNLAGQIMNAYSTTANNALQMKYNNSMYTRQRKDALVDWNMVNDYNSPQAQMARLKAAGLNPNLMYGNGTAATGVAQAPRGQDVKQFSPQAPQFDFGSVVGQYMATQMQEHAMDKLEKQNALLDQEQALRQAQAARIYADIALKASQRDKTDTDTQLGGVKLSYATRIQAMSLEAMRVGIEKSIQDTKLSSANTQFRLDENERASLRTGMTLAEGAERILRMRAQTINDNARTDYQRQLANVQIKEINERIEKIKADTKGSSERARLLNSTPNWWTQQGVSTVQSVVGNVGKKLIGGSGSTKSEPYRPAPLRGYKYGKNSKTWEPDDWKENY